MVDEHKRIRTLGEKMSETCPVVYETRLYKRPRCGANFVRREPILSSESMIGHLKGPKNIKGCRTGEDEVLYYMYECENGHLVNRPEWYADVPTVPVGTITARGDKEHPEWYREGIREIRNRPPGGWFSERGD